MNIAKCVAPFSFVVLVYLMDIWTVKAEKTDSCILAAHSPAGYDQAVKDCKARNASLLGAPHLIPASASEQYGRVIVRFLDNHTIWYISNDSRPTQCHILNRENGNLHLQNVACTHKHHYFCIFYNEPVNSSQCIDESPLPSTPSGTPLTTKLTTLASTADQVATPNTAVTIICVYISCVAIIVIGGILVVKIRHCRKEQDEIYYPPFRVQTRLPIMCGSNYPRYYRREYPYTPQPRIRNLSTVEELLDQNASVSSVNLEDDSEPSKNVPNAADDTVYEAFDFHAERQGRACPLTPELYTPLLNPGETFENTLFFGRHFDFHAAGEPSQEEMENPVYEPFSVTTRL